ncbi:MAG: hypothetical protein HFJ12_06785 [Bacilli bacterium]|nr:hypothetical protein [Bacilli bacterium]
MNERYFTLIRKDVLHNNELSLGAKGLYCLICYDVTKSLRRLLLDPTTRDEVKNKDSYIGLHISVQPEDSFKEKIDSECEKMKKEYEL